MVSFFFLLSMAFFDLRVCVCVCVKTAGKQGQGQVVVWESVSVCCIWGRIVWAVVFESALGCSWVWVAGGEDDTGRCHDERKFGVDGCGRGDECR